MRKDILDFLKWLDGLFIGFLAIVMMVFCYLIFSLWFLWRVMKWTCLGKPMIMEDFPMRRVFDVICEVFLAPITGSMKVVSVIKEVYHAKRSENLSD